jgi:DNA-binding XRE family transcriptional regulator
MKMDNLINMELHKAIKQMRQDRKYTQVMLSSKIGISTFTLIRWERGERLPDGKLLQKLSKILKYAIVLNTDGMWSCFPRDDLLTLDEEVSISSNDNVDELYRMASEAKDKSVWKIFFSRLVKDNVRLETWFRNTNGGEDMDDKDFRVISDVILAIVKSER